VGVAARSLVGHLAIASGLGSEVAGTASNLGRRVSGKPRVAVSARLGTVRAGLPDLADPSALREVSFFVPTVHADVALGLFDGFRIMPTVGGFLSLDVFGQASLALLPGDVGFNGRATGLGIGARVGIFRESFTLPGVSVSVSRRYPGSPTLGSVADGDPAQLGVDAAVTSFRATVGKDLFAVEVLAGVGWDDASADAAFAVSTGLGGPATGVGRIDASRRLYFLGAATSFNLVFSLSAEAGLASGFDPVSGYTGAFDPTGASFFGSLALRLTI
jgi:hypothetical protein